jgi:hypothetical protein
MKLFLRDIKRAIAKAIRETEGLALDKKFDLVDKAMERCDTLENAQEYIIQLGLNVPIGEHLANAHIAAEAQETVVDQATKVSVATNMNRGVETSALEDKMRTEKSAKLDSASLRPNTPLALIITNTSREYTAKLLAQDKTYRSDGGKRPIFDAFLTEQMSKEHVREDATLQTRAAPDLSDMNFSAPGPTANAVKAAEETLSG